MNGTAEVVSRRAATIPVVVMRWFADGCGYARDTRIDEPTLRAVAAALEPVLPPATATDFCVPLPGGRRLLGDRQDDPDCPDPLARNRGPYLIRAAVLDGPPDADR